MGCFRIFSGLLRGSLSLVLFIYSALILSLSYTHHVSIHAVYHCHMEHFTVILSVYLTKLYKILQGGDGTIFVIFRVSSLIQYCHSRELLDSEEALSVKWVLYMYCIVCIVLILTGLPRLFMEAITSSNKSCAYTIDLYHITDALLKFDQTHTQNTPMKTTKQN